VAENGNWTGELSITGIGLVTPVGLSAPAALAALRAGVSRLEELPGVEIEKAKDEFAPALGAVVPTIPAGRRGVARLLRMAAPALLEALEQAALPPGTKGSLHIGLDVENPSGRTLPFSGAFTRGFEGAVPRAKLDASVTPHHGGRAAALIALRKALAEFTAGPDPVLVVGGVDSWSNPRSLMGLRKAGRLPEFPHHTGIMPGEAAGFLVIEKPEHAQRRGATVIARLLAAAGATETVPHGEPSRATGLTEALKPVTALVGEAAPLVISDFNGERPRGLEWGIAGIRGFGYFRDDIRHWHPADCIGDCGAASGAVTMAWAASTLHRRLAPERRVVVWGASDEGAREAVLIAPAEGVEE
jgi:3-oxoacyl-[acyl-carrier-protein] synthase-1